MFLKSKKQVCSCHKGFKLSEDILEIAKKKALHNQDILADKMEELKKNGRTSENCADGKARTEAERKLTEEVQQFLELRKEDSSKDDSINPKMDKLLSKVDELERRISELVQRLPAGELTSPLSKHQVQEEDTSE